MAILNLVIDQVAINKAFPPKTAASGLLFSADGAAPQLVVPVLTPNLDASTGVQTVDANGFPEFRIQASADLDVGATASGSWSIQMKDTSTPANDLDIPIVGTYEVLPNAIIAIATVASAKVL